MHGADGLVVDDREKALCEALGGHEQVCVSTARLLVGDVHVVRDGSVALVIERKTRTDLLASLRDGRFARQRAAMIEKFSVDRVVYIVEGSTDWQSNESGAEIALVLRDRVPLFWSNGVTDTAALLARLVKCTLQQRTEPPDPTNCTRIAKATTACPERSLAAMLRCVPGVSAKRAASIAHLFGSMAGLAESVRADRSDTITRISDCRERPGSNRFGHTLAYRVVACVSGT